MSDIVHEHAWIVIEKYVHINAMFATKEKGVFVLRTLKMVSNNGKNEGARVYGFKVSTRQLEDE